MSLGPRELAELRLARELLENPSLAARLTDLLGRPLERSARLLPASVLDRLHAVVERSLGRALDVALHTMADRPRVVASPGLHKLAGAATGAVGGMFGLAGLAVELPVTTVIMLRSIGDVARGEGHSLADPAVRLSCLEVFALGGPSRADDAAETGYFAVRAALSKLVTDAAQHVASRGVARAGGPALVRLIESIAARFGVVVQEKVAFELVPAIGAAGGALINAVFIGHFQSMARGHFIVKRLEERHGQETVRRAWAEYGPRPEVARR